MKQLKNLIVSLILGLTMFAAFAFPKPKYQSFDLIEYLNIPLEIAAWRGEEVINKDAEKLDLNVIAKSKQFYFWKEDGTGAEAYLSLIDAENFHNPKACFTGSGYEPRFFGSFDFELADNAVIRGDSFLMLKEKNDLLTTYWMCIDGKRVSWIEQKLKDLLFSLLNKRRNSLMVRVDVPLYSGDQDEIDNALRFTKNFIRDISYVVDKDKRKYVFGEPFAKVSSRPSIP